MHRGVRRRLPKGPAAFDRPFVAEDAVTGAWPRVNREVESERHLANIHGTFYEVPLVVNGQPPAFHQMRPVASHRRQIMDYWSWNGLLVLTGISANARPSEHIYLSDDGTAAVWFGGIDDLWKLGKPVGVGGPWKNTQVLPGQPSDPYLMTGYDQKVLTLSASVDTAITLEVDVDHQSGWHRYRQLNVKAGQPLRFEFPAGFSAHWIRFVCEHACSASAVLEYR